MDRMIAGYGRFRQSAWPDRRRLFETLATDGQAPRALVISCADSRVDPGMIFDAAPGELFVVRNVANLIPPYAPDGALHGTSAALEFAVRVLKVPDVLVMGHGLCGGVRALLEGPPPELSDFIAPWISQAVRARERAMAHPESERQLICEQETVRLTLDNLMTFPWVKARVAAGEMRLTGGHFDIRTGVLSLLNRDGTFETVIPD
jgi:carbonic anhydrase